MKFLSLFLVSMCLCPVYSCGTEAMMLQCGESRKDTGIIPDQIIIKVREGHSTGEVAQRVAKSMGNAEVVKVFGKLALIKLRDADPCGERGKEAIQKALSDPGGGNG